MEQTNNSKGEIILYQPDELVKLEVRLEDETVWLTQAQIVDLFKSSKANISEHLKNIFSSKELETVSTVRNFRTVRKEGNREVIRNIDHYNLDVIISVGYRVNTVKGILFRQWATRVIKEYLLRGYVINQRFERLENRVSETEKKIDFFVKTSLPPVQGIFYDGQIFDAYTFISNLVKSAKKSILLIDNYVDESVLLLLSKRKKSVNATVYTARQTRPFQLDLQKHNAQYPPIAVKIFSNSHDRFICIDEEVYHIGASLKDLGKKWFAFSKMNLKSKELLKNIS